ncbi:MAG: hypothetical protein ACN6PJ_27450 [Achromobacter sp.]|uniref:hypothetical protein n=1 Tax=Achromobacter sp. TaxID=134375 RepID=UPI003D00952B
MSFLQRIWKATETDRGVFADWGQEIKDGARKMAGETWFIIVGLFILIAPLLILAAFGYAYIEGLLVPLAKGVLRIFG